MVCSAHIFFLLSVSLNETVATYLQSQGIQTLTVIGLDSVTSL
jgi:hypothetical protein